MGSALWWHCLWEVAVALLGSHSYFMLALSIAKLSSLLHLLNVRRDQLLSLGAGRKRGNWHHYILPTNHGFWSWGLFYILETFWLIWWRLETPWSQTWCSFKLLFAPLFSNTQTPRRVRVKGANGHEILKWKEDRERERESSSTLLGPNKNEIFFLLLLFFQAWVWLLFMIKLLLNITFTLVTERISDLCICIHLFEPPGSTIGLEI